MQVLNRNILIELPKAVKETTLSSGIILSHGEQGVVLEKAKVIELDEAIESVKIGDVVFYKDYALSRIDIDGKDCAFLKEEDVLGIEK